MKIFIKIYFLWHHLLQVKSLIKFQGMKPLSIANQIIEAFDNHPNTNIVIVGDVDSEALTLKLANKFGIRFTKVID